MAERLSSLSDPEATASRGIVRCEATKRAMDAAACARPNDAGCRRQAGLQGATHDDPGGLSQRRCDSGHARRQNPYRRSSLWRWRLLTGLYRYSPFLVILVAAVIGFVLPESWLFGGSRLGRNVCDWRLPDGLDLLVICVEIGLGLDQALMKVAQEMRVVHPELSDELQMVNLEMRVGKTRMEALRELANRTGSEDIKTLVAMLIQTERFGTSIAQSLRIHSDELRHEAPARRRNERQDDREDGRSPGFLHLPGVDGGDFGSGGDHLGAAAIARAEVIPAEPVLHVGQNEKRKERS